MAKEWTEKDIESLISGSIFSNPAHKEALRKRLLEPEVVELGLDDLVSAAGGIKLPEEDKP